MEGITAVMCLSKISISSKKATEQAYGHKVQQGLLSPTVLSEKSLLTQEASIENNNVCVLELASPLFI